MKHTAVEWLVDKLKSQGLLIGEPNNLVAVREALEMEKEQIESAYYTGAANFSEHSTKAVRWSKQYYNETFKK
jgi:hypothetical protein